MLIRALAARGNGRRPWSLSLLSSSAAFLRQRPYDIVHCQFGTLGGTAAALQEIGAVGGKLVVSFRGTDVTTGNRVSTYDKSFQKGHLFLPVCERFREQLVRQGCDPKKIRVHHSGIKLSRFAFRERRPTADQPIKILTVARLVEKKGVAYAIQAMARLRADGRRVLYTVVGDGPLRAELDLMIDRLGLRGAVQLVGPKTHEEVVALLQAAHLVVTPSVTAESGDQEGIPNVLKEAMASGLPVVSSRHSGIPELVEEDVSGFLVPERDSDALADRLAYLIDHPERWPAMGRAGRERVEVEFDSEKLNKKLVELYQEVLTGDTQRP
jgi:colanic acid/amylovoran biosynthesis glycosyltransferase